MTTTMRVAPAAAVPATAPATKTVQQLEREVRKLRAQLKSKQPVININPMFEATLRRDNSHTTYTLDESGDLKESATRYEKNVPVTHSGPKGKSAPSRHRIPWRDDGTEVFAVHARLGDDKKEVVFAEKMRVFALEVTSDLSEFVPVTAQGRMTSAAFRPSATGFHVLQIGRAGPERQFMVLGAATPAERLKQITPAALREFLWRLGIKP